MYVGTFRWNYINNSRELKVCVDHEEGRTVLGERLNGDVVGGWRGNWWYIEGEAVGPATWLNWLNIGEVLVVDELAEEVAFEVDDTNVYWLGPDAAKVEKDGRSKVGWVGVAEGLALVHQEVAHIVDLLKLHAVGDGGLNVEGWSKLDGSLFNLPDSG